MTDSLEAHAVSYAHELEAMIRQKNAEIARLRDAMTSAVHWVDIFGNTPESGLDYIRKALGAEPRDGG